MSKYRHSTILSVLILLVSLVLPVNSSASRENVRAPEFPAELPWLNVSRPLVLDDLRGRVVILDFWTYGCINCIHVAEELKRLEETFGEDLVVIGVHSPKFDNERRLSTLRHITLRYDRRHPIVNDIDLRMMRLYRARAWPTLVVLDPQGGVEGYVTGEGHEELLARTVKRLLKDAEDGAMRRALPVALERDRVESSYLAAPGKVAVDGDRVAISDTLHHRLLIADTNGSVLQVIGDGRPGLRDGPPQQARFRTPQGVLFVGKQLYVADTGNHALRKVDLSTGEVTLVAGTGQIGDLKSGEFKASAVGLRSPWDLAWDGIKVYVAMAGTHQIWQYDPKLQRIAAWAGTSREGIEDGKVSEATFSQPSGLAIHDGTLFVADPEASAIRVIDLADQSVKTIVGTGLFDFGDRDGLTEKALLQHPLGIAAADDGKVVVADTYNHKLKIIDLKNRKIATVAGSGSPGRQKNGAMLMNEPGGAAMLGKNVLIADTNNDRILLHDLSEKSTEIWMIKPFVSTGD